MHVLIIEDETLISKSLTRLLQSKGATVDAANSGSEGLRLLEINIYNRIVCDLMLQDITGFDIIEACKGFMTNEEIRNRFIIMTAYSSPDVIQKAAQYGCPVLKKPFENLHQTINLILGRENNECI